MSDKENKPYLTVLKLKNHTELITGIDDSDIESGVITLINPKPIIFQDGKIIITQRYIFGSNDVEITIPADEILASCKPSEDIIDVYYKIVDGSISDEYVEDQPQKLLH